MKMRLGHFIQGKAQNVAHFSITTGKPKNLHKVALQLAKLGFDKTSISKNSIDLTRVDAKDFTGKPVLFTRIKISEGKLQLWYSYQEKASQPQRHLQACLLLLRVLSLFQGLQVDSKEIAAVILFAYESCLVLPQEAAALSVRLKQCQDDCRELSEKLASLQKQREKDAIAAIQQQRKIEALQARIFALESVSDEVLSELILEWIEVHKGKFSVAEFSKHHQIAPGRVEEGLKKLAVSRAIAKLPQAQTFEIRKGLFSAIKSILKQA
ncbi:MAG: hypothetical protein QXT25_00360 [Candidatus Anstonellaceae archaeon]